MPSQNYTEQLTLPVNGFHFDALAEGPKEGPLVLLLHGFPEFADAWLEIMHPLAAAGFRALAVNQRGYSSQARPSRVEEYALKPLLSDVLGFAGHLGAKQFHLVAHDWGGLLAWQFAAEHPERLRSLSVLSTPHTDAFLEAVQTDADQKQRSSYIELFRMPNATAESYFQANDYQPLRRVYQGKVPEDLVIKNIRRLMEPGALTAALNWYRALDPQTRIGPIAVPTLFIWGSADLAVGETAAVNTASHVTGPYWFERLEGKSHWLLEELPAWIATRLLQHLHRPETERC